MNASGKPPSDEVDATKGLLVLLVVLGHDSVLTERFPRFFTVVYNFHVLAFLLLPFALSAPKFTWRGTTDRAVRYLVPYGVFAVGAAIAYRWLDGALTSPFVWVQDLLVALVRGDASALKRATGFTAFWFLPALFSLAVLRSLVNSAPATVRSTILILFVATHLTIGAWPWWARYGPPLGSSIALFVFPLGALVEFLRAPLAKKGPFVAAGAALGAFTCGLTALRLSSVSNVGALTVFTWKDFDRVLLHDAYALLAFAAALTAGPWLRHVPLLTRLGRDSLAIYLTHLFAIQLYVRVSQAVGAPTTGQMGLLNVATSAVVVVALSMFAAGCLQHDAIRAWVFPRGLDEWALVCVLRRLGRR